MAIHPILSRALAIAALLCGAGCSEPERGPITVSAIGEPPALVNPNLETLGPPASFLAEAVAQGLVQFDAGGQVQPALAQSWIVSDDGLRYTFRLGRAEWANGERVTAEQVTARLQAAVSGASRNDLKPLLGVIDEIEAMTDDVLEISLKSPRPNFLQLLAQPEMGVLRDGEGTGPFHAAPREDGIFLSQHRPDEEEVGAEPHGPPVLLRGEPAAMAVARFDQGLADFVTGGTLGDLPIARAAEPGAALRFDPVAGLFGLVFLRDEGVLGDPAIRRALSMAVDRAALVAALEIPELQPRASLLPPSIDELPRPAQPDWAESPLPMRREQAAQAIEEISGGEPLVVRVAMPDEPGYRLVFAHLGRDWRAIGVQAERVGPNQRADLRLVDAVAPATLASWYLRFICDAAAVCGADVHSRLAAARMAASAVERRIHLAGVDRLLTDMTAFIPLAAPVRWSLVSPRVTGFQPNPFGRHTPATLVAPEG